MIERVRTLVEERRSNSRRKLRRQPKMRRVDAGGFRLPGLDVPRTAKKRRRRNRAALRLPKAAIKQFILSSRWVSLFLLAICVFALVVVGMNEGFYLTRIPVEGVASIPPEEIVEASGLAGAHIFSANPGDAAKKIAGIPGVISATVALEWPNSAIIRIKEDKPIAVWEQGGQTYWINAAGTLVPARADVPGLLHIRAELTEEVVAEADEDGTAVAVEEEATERAENEARENSDEVAAAPAVPFVPDEVLQGALELRALRPNIDVLYYDISGGLSYEDGRGWRAYFGTGTHMAEKLAVYETLVEHLIASEQTPVYISVSNEEKPFYLTRDS